MKLSEFRKPVPKTVELPDGTKFDIGYNPRFLTQDKIDAYYDVANPIKEDGARRDPKEFFTAGWNFLDGVLKSWDFEDDAGTMIVITRESIQSTLDDLDVLTGVLNAIMGVGKKENPTGKEGEDSSSGSPEGENSTQTS